MKGASTLVLIASYLVCQIESLGICYDPKHVDQVTPDVIKKDMKQLKDMGYTAIRTYSTGDNMGQIAMEAGLDVALGIPYPGGSVQADVETAIKLATSGSGPGKIKVIFVGNENFSTDKDATPQMIELIKSIKAKAPGVKVGTVQRQTEFLDATQAVNNMAALVEAVDVIGVNIHPLFGGSANGKAGMDSLKAQWQSMKGLDGKYPGLSKKLALTEVGWPSGGKNNASPQIAADFYKGYMEWSSTVPEDQYYFQAYDQPGRGKNGEGEFEKFFGIIDKDGKAKYPDVKVAGGGGKTPDTNTTTSAPPVTQGPSPGPNPSPTPQKSVTPGPNPGPSPQNTPTRTPPSGTPGPAPQTTTVPPNPQVTPTVTKPVAHDVDDDCDEDFSMAGDNDDCDDFSMAGENDDCDDFSMAGDSDKTQKPSTGRLTPKPSETKPLPTTQPPATTPPVGPKTTPPTTPSGMDLQNKTTTPPKPSTTTTTTTNGDAHQSDPKARPVPRGNTGAPKSKPNPTKPSSFSFRQNGRQ